MLKNVDSCVQDQYHAVFVHLRGKDVTNPPSTANREAEDLTEDDDVLTDVEIELLDLYESASEDAQAALIRVAQFLEAHPQDVPLTKEKMEELFLSARNLQ